MSRPAKPRAADVAQWVAILAAPVPPNYGGGALAAVMQRRANARGKLASWGLGHDGLPKVKAVAS